MDWPADNVERIAVSRLIPSARNARTHSDAQVAQIAASIQEWGWTMPVLVDEAGELIAGHGRVLAARKLGLPDAPAMTARGWSPAQIAAYRIADNKLTLNGGWDDQILKAEFADLEAGGFDLALTGFGDQELAGFRGAAGLTDPDDAPEAPQEPASALGDVWLLGRHRLVCGDSTAQETVCALMDGARADLCFTSPPYAQQRDYDGARAHVQDWDVLMQGVFENAPMGPAGQMLVNLGLVHRNGEWVPYWDGWIEWMRGQGWRRFGWYVWDQGPGLPGDWNGRLAPSHEFVFHFNQSSIRARKTKAKKPENIAPKTGTGLRRADGSMSGVSSPDAGLQPNKVPDSVIRVMRHKGKAGHPAVFPVALAEEVLTAFSDAGEIVYEPFSGSGTTIIAAEMTGQACHAIEISPAYVDVAVLRWQSFAGQQATLDGKTFDEVKAQRQKKAA